MFTSRFYAENLTIRNTSGNVGQAEALYICADAHILKDCILSGYQDTYKSNVGGRGYFTGCTISGATDFIYDGGLEWFENCKIVCVKGGGYITAPADAWLTLSRAVYPELTDAKFYAGLFFRNCDITAEDGVAAGAYYLAARGKRNQVRCSSDAVSALTSTNLGGRTGAELRTHRRSMSIRIPMRRAIL